MISFTITGNPISSKNAIRSGMTKSGRNYTYVLKAVKDYRDSALKQLREQMCLGTMSEPGSMGTRALNLDMVWFYKEENYKETKLPIQNFCQVSFIFYCCDMRKRDLCNLIQCPADLLQQSGIIQNDYLIINLDGSRIMEVDKLNPRTIINITIL